MSLTHGLFNKPYNSESLQPVASFVNIKHETPVVEHVTNPSLLSSCIKAELVCEEHTLLPLI